jgi:dCTP deaminase
VKEKLMTGVLPSQKIKTMIDTNQIILSNPIDEDQIQPASLDLRLGNKAYRSFKQLQNA